MDTISDIMTRDVVTLAGSAPILEAARRMRDSNVGAVVVRDGGKPCGLVTDRDIAVRVIAAGLDPAKTPLSKVCSKDVTALSPDDGLDRAIELMRTHAVRRAPVVKDGAVVGIVSLGDLAIARDPKSVLGQISAATPTR